MASVAYNFMVVDPNAHSRRYSQNHHNDPRDNRPLPDPPREFLGDPRRQSSVALEMEDLESPIKRRRSRKKSASATDKSKDNKIALREAHILKTIDSATILQQVKVQVCVQFFKVGEIDTLKEQYTADVIVRARWREPTLDGKISESGDITDIKKYWNPKLYIENSYGDPKEMFRYRVVFNDKGEAYMSEKRTVKGTFMENLELDDFPFDVQDLTVTVASEFPYTEVEVVEDFESRHMVNKQSFVDEQEWHLYAHTESNRRELIIDQFDPSARRSAISVRCRAARRPGYFIWNIFMVTAAAKATDLVLSTSSIVIVCCWSKNDACQTPYYPICHMVISKWFERVSSRYTISAASCGLAVLQTLFSCLSFATFSVEKNLPQNRLQLSFTLVLTAVAFKSVVNQSLPRISYLTYMDKYLLASMIMLSAVCTWHGIVTTLVGNRPSADYIENIVLGCLGVVYVVYNIGFCIMIYVFPCKKRRIMAQKDREHYKVYEGDKELRGKRAKHSYSY